MIILYLAVRLFYLRVYLSLYDKLDLPKLTSIKLGSYSLAGDDENHCKVVAEEPFNYINMLIMKSDY